MKRLSLTIIPVLLILSFLSFVTQPVAHAAGLIASSPSGYAYAAYATTPLGATFGQSGSTLGPVAEVGMACDPLSHSAKNSIANVSLANLMRSGSAQTSVTTYHNSKLSSIQTTSTLQNLNVLGGLITAKQVRARITSKLTSTSAKSTVDEATFIGLKVAGRSITGSVARNSIIRLPKLGYVGLNEENLSNGRDMTSVSITMIDVHVTMTNSFKLKAGTHFIIVAASSQNLRTLQPAFVGAVSFGALTQISAHPGSVSSTAVNPAAIGCGGGNAQNSASSSSIPSAGTTGQVIDTASGQLARTGAFASSSSTVSNLYLFRGLIQASKVKAVANASWNGHGTSAATTTLADVKVSNISLLVSSAPNTHVAIPGLGYMVLNEQSSSNTSTHPNVTVNGIDIYVTTPNIYGIPVGTQYIFAHANAGVSSY